MNNSCFFAVVRALGAIILSTALFAPVSAAAIHKEHKVITDTPVDNLRVAVEDMADTTTGMYQGIQLLITADVVLPSGQEENVAITEKVVPVAIKDVPGALSMTSLFRDRDTVIARERLSDGAFFPIGRIDSDGELVLDSNYELQVVYRQYRYTLHDRIVGSVLGTDTKDSDSVLISIVSSKNMK